MAKSQPTAIAIGKNRGHKTTKIQAKRPRPVSTKAKIGKRTKLVRQIISQVAGVAGYEKRVIEFLKAGSLKDTKRALKATKKALGTHRRAKLKRENLMNLLRAQQAKKKWSLPIIIIKNCQSSASLKPFSIKLALLYPLIAYCMLYKVVNKGINKQYSKIKAH